jgi:hypothetical protein
MKPLPQPARKPRVATALFLGFTATSSTTITSGIFRLLLLREVPPEDLNALFDRRVPEPVVIKEVGGSSALLLRAAGCCWYC